MEARSTSLNVPTSRIGLNREYIIDKYIDTTSKSVSNVKLKPRSLNSRNKQSYSTVPSVLQYIMRVGVRKYARLRACSPSNLLVTLCHIASTDTDILYEHLPRVPL
jgi:hypothetical protein